jgi:hypothetical protein
MLSVRILGDGGWQFVASGSLAALLPPPPHLRSLLEIYLCTGYCALYIDWAYVSLRDCVAGLFEILSKTWKEPIKVQWALILWAAQEGMIFYMVKLRQ